MIHNAVNPRTRKTEDKDKTSPKSLLVTWR